ncbi:hypothetical protein A4G23_04553 [Streptomyces rubrolavendulae]|uniref:Uncharacterized protein n=1 Tax=Streptomyces rubrolavendulae TaxID=285473 RepID=A0A1D8G893_9ACTN|nr:hypothetical protein A4G23_04553 [Streptomyces rubrolavendulae]
MAVPRGGVERLRPDVRPVPAAPGGPSLRPADRAGGGRPAEARRVRRGVRHGPGRPVVPPPDVRDVRLRRHARLRRRERFAGRHCAGAPHRRGALLRRLRAAGPAGAGAVRGGARRVLPVLRTRATRRRDCWTWPRRSPRTGSATATTRRRRSSWPASWSRGSASSGAAPPDWTSPRSTCPPARAWRVPPVSGRSEGRGPCAHPTGSPSACTPPGPCAPLPRPLSAVRCPIPGPVPRPVCRPVPGQVSGPIPGPAPRRSAGRPVGGPYSETQTRRSDP